MATKLVNGKKVNLSAEEKAEIESEGAAKRQKYEEWLVTEKYKEDRREEILKRAPIYKQLEAITETFALMRLNGIDMSTKMDSLLGTLAQIKGQFPKPEQDKGG